MQILGLISLDSDEGKKCIRTSVWGTSLSFWGDRFAHCGCIHVCTCTQVGELSSQVKCGVAGGGGHVVA